jgi:hypothetical protein
MPIENKTVEGIFVLNMPGVGTGDCCSIKKLKVNEKLFPQVKLYSCFKACVFNIIQPLLKTKQ